MAENNQLNLQVIGIGNDLITCPYCNAANPEDATYCVECGKRMGVCLSCNRPLPNNQLLIRNHCPSCGALINPKPAPWYKRMQWPNLQAAAFQVFVVCLTAAGTIAAIAIVAGLAAGTVVEPRVNSDLDSFHAAMVITFIVTGIAMVIAGCWVVYDVYHLEQGNENVSPLELFWVAYAFGLSLILFLEAIFAWHTSNTKIDTMAHVFWVLTAAAIGLSCCSAVFYAFVKAHAVQPAAN